MAATILTGASFLPCCSFKLGSGGLQTDKKALLLNKQLHYTLVRNHMEKQGTTCITRAVAEVEPETSDAVSYDPNESMLMLFKAEGTVPDASIPDVTKALKDLEGVENVEVASNEAMTTISAVKRTTIQATSVASEMVEAIEKSASISILYIWVLMTLFLHKKSLFSCIYLLITHLISLQQFSRTTT